LYYSGAYDQAAIEYNVLYPSLRHERQFLFEFGQCLAKIKQYEKSNLLFEEFLHYSSDPMAYNCIGNNYKAMKAYQQAEKMYLYASWIVPNRHYPFYLLMKLYDEIGDKEKAYKMAQILLEKPVKIQSTAIREMLQEAEKWIQNNQN
jgi:tetratricopeptide (TPR) repeat protein